VLPNSRDFDALFGSPKTLFIVMKRYVWHSYFLQSFYSLQSQISDIALLCVIMWLRTKGTIGLDEYYSDNFSKL
jgi:hypothetical protein